MMKKQVTLLSLLLFANIAAAQNVGILRENYISYYFDSTLMIDIEVLDSSTIRLGSINPITGVVTNVGNAEYNCGINLNSATIDPYLNRYYIGRGFDFLTFDINTGEIINEVPIFGSLPSSAFQNFRFNNSDSTIYGMIPNNFYSIYYDSIAMMDIEVLDSTQIRFASLNPATGQYTLIGNTSFNDIYTLAGNSIDPYQMIYYYSAVDTLIGIDLYSGTAYSTAPIQLPPDGIFENIVYSCIDTAIYGLTRQNHISTVFDSLFMGYIQVVDSTTFRLSKINPNSGQVTFVSPMNIGIGANLTGGAFVDPNSMIYYFSNGNQIVGVSMITGLITSIVSKTYPSNAIALDMMRSTQNCFGATKTRFNNPTGADEFSEADMEIGLFPNPAHSEITVNINIPFIEIELLNSKGNLVLKTKEKAIDISGLPNGIYLGKVVAENGKVVTGKFIKN